MIKEILKMLKSSDFLDGDEDINIAKGKYEQPTTREEYIMHKKRNR